METHALEISHGLTWAVGVIGSLLFTLAVYVARRWMEEAETFRTEVTDELKAIRKLLGDETQALRELVHDIDKRVVKIESHCSLYHGSEQWQQVLMRRKADE